MTDLPETTGFEEWIGREDVAEETLTGSLVERFAATIGLSAVASDPDGVAPRLIHFCLCQPAAPMSELGEDGHVARGGFLPPIALPRRMWAASDILFTGDIHVGDRVTRRSRVADISVKHGRTGNLCFVTVDHAISVRDVTVINDRQTIVYRGAASAQAAPPLQSSTEIGEHVERFDASAPLLFRYSALTFNSHRIHYDQQYSADVEGYPDLVVQGPLQATLLYHMAARLHGGAPDRFSFRGNAPLFRGDGAQLHTVSNDDGMKLWTVRDGGPIAMTAKASWS